MRGRASLGNWLLLLSIFLVACHGRDSASRPAAQTTDEIILITIDTWRADAVGFAGNTRVKTPFLDSLAARGTVFSNAHAHNVVTLPSHVNILTGLYPYQQGVGENAGFRPRCENRDAFRNTAARGGRGRRVPSSAPLDSRYGLKQGFDVYDDNYGKGVDTLDFGVQERPATALRAGGNRPR